MERKTVEVETTGQAYLELLRERGIDYFFANGGTDFAPLIDGFARFAEQGKQTPRPITVPHENAAVAMAATLQIPALFTCGTRIRNP